jgi:purine-nucleoside phosphorylase
MYDKVTKETMVRTHFGCEIEDIAKNVILTPIWSLESFKAAADDLIKEFVGWYKGITVVYKGQRITVISSGIGAPMSGDCALALQYTDCENIIFSGSAGAVNEQYNIGDLLAVKQAVIGEGFSRYHRDDMTKDCFGELAEGDSALSGNIMEVIKQYALRFGTAYHEGRISSIDSILGETKETFDYIQQKGCDAVEMEVSAVLTACRRAGKKAAALIIISDLPLKYRSLFEGITEADVVRYNNIKRELSVIILEAALLSA